MDKKANYNQKEIDRLPVPEVYSYALQIVNGEGHKTNWMNITHDQLAKIREILGHKGE